MTRSDHSKCKIPKCKKKDEVLFDPCSEKHFYVCTHSKIWMPCPAGTHFAREKEKLGCFHIYNTTSEKEKFLKSCEIPTDYCQKKSSTDATQSNTTILPGTSQEINFSLLFAVILLWSYVIFLLGIIIFLLKKRKKLKQRNDDNMNKNNQQPEKVNEESVYEEIDESQMIATIPAQMIDFPETYYTLEFSENSPHQKGLHEDRPFNKYSSTNTDTQEEMYNILYVAEIQQDLKPNEIPPE